MANVINPKDFLLQLKRTGKPLVMISPSVDMLEIAELGIILPLSKVLNPSEFYDALKKAVSEFNADAALNGTLYLDFDDLHTKYSEYMEVLERFITRFS